MRVKLQFTKDRKQLNLQEIEDEYKIDINDIFNEDSERYKLLYNIIFNKLTEFEKNVILVYAETQNQKKLGELLGVSTATTNKEIQRIRTKIKEEIKKLI